MPTSNMGLGQTVVLGESSAVAIAKIEANTLLIDAHDHSTGKGVQIGTNGIANLAVTTAKLATTGIAAGSYTNVNVTVGVDGRITAISNGNTASSAVTAGSAVTTLSLTGLNGNTDRHYRVIGLIKSNNLGDTALRLRPNGATTNLYSHFFFQQSGAVNQATDAGWFLGTMRGSRDMKFTLDIYCKTGSRRYFTCHAESISTAPVFIAFWSAGCWDETATNITSLDIVADTAGAIDTGSYAAAFKPHTVL